MKTMTKERPIIFSGPMVRAILAGKKRQTRRVIKPQPPACDETCARTRFYDMGDGAGWACANCGAGVRPVHRNGQCVDAMGIKCPYGQPGDVLWVKETWQTLKRAGYASMTDYGPEWDDALEVCDPKDPGVELAYRATDGDSTDLADMPWRPSIFMPRWASRIRLPLKSVRVERVQDISEEDVRAEGCEPTATGIWAARNKYALLWDSINGKTYPWASNPWVWVLEFEVQA